MVNKIITDNSIEYLCDIDSTVLWIEYLDGTEKPVSSCTHWKWEEIGNGCYPIKLNNEFCKKTDTVVKYAQKIIQDGTVYYFLIPNLRHYD